MGWLLNRKIKKIKELVEQADFSVKDVDVFKFSDWFEYRDDEFFKERLCVYWRNRKNMSEQDKAIFKVFNLDCPICRTSKIEDDSVDSHVNDLITNIKGAIKRYCKIREVLVDEPYLKNYILRISNYDDKYSAYVKLTPFTAMNYLAEVEKHHSDWEQNILTEYRNFIKGLFVREYKDLITGDYPSIDAWTFITWHFKNFLPDLEAKGRTIICQGFIDEIKAYREELEADVDVCNDKEKKNKKDKK